MIRTLRILVVNWRDITHPLAGGAEVCIHEMAKRWREKGHDVTLLCGSYKGALERQIQDGVRVSRCGSSYSTYMLAPFRYLSLRGSYDLVFESVNTIPFFTPLYVKVPAVALIYQWTSLKLLLLETMFPLAVSASALQSLMPMVYKNAGILTISESSKRELTRHGFDPTKMSVIHPAIDPRLWVNYDMAEKSFTKNLVYIGRLKRYKGILTLIRAFENVVKKHKEATLQIVGKGDLLPEIEAMIELLGLTDKVVIRGYLDEGCKADALFESAVAVYPGEYFDGGWSIACAEAMALGAVPVVSQNLRDMVVESGAGVTYETGDPLTLSQALNGILSDAELWSRMSAIASHWARRFTWQNAADQALNETIRFTGVGHESH